MASRGHPATGNGASPSPSEARIGELLVARGVTGREAIDAALAEQRETGALLGEILVDRGEIGEEELIAALGEQQRLPLVDLEGFIFDPVALAEVPPEVARMHACVPLARDDRTLYVAVARPLDESELASLREHTTLELRQFLTTERSIDELLERMLADDDVEVATTDLLRRYPEDSANRVLSSGQRWWLGAAVVLVLLLLVLYTRETAIVSFALAGAYYLAVSAYRVWLTYRALGHDYELHVTPEEVASLDDRALATYTILVPLYQEASVVPRFVDAIEALDYPKNRLDVRLLCEADDGETIEAIRRLALPPHFRLVLVPDSGPRTKPKACNYGLLHAKGAYVVIFDAEDRPAPDQLKRVAIAFSKAGEGVVCIQAKLNYFNPRQNLLTRWFAIEYAMWFDLMLPGLDKEGVPIPLGGTSNHFVRERLVELGAWDPFNVTEDADLGVRLRKAGFQTAIVDSTTLEEANSQVGNWVRQRSRWVKGYIQTWLVHMRHPLRLLNGLGLKGWLSFQLVVGGTFVFLLNPIFWLLTTLYFVTGADWIESLFPAPIFYVAASLLFLGNFLFVYVNVAGAHERGYFDLVKYALLSPLYWGLISLGAWKGFIQLFTRPFYWEKTVHGLDGGAGEGDG